MINVLEFVRTTIAKREKRHSLDIDTRRWLKRYYNEDVHSLKELTGKSFNQWSDFSG